MFTLLLYQMPAFPLFSATNFHTKTRLKDLSWILFFCIHVPFSSISYTVQTVLFFFFETVYPIYEF